MGLGVTQALSGWAISDRNPAHVLETVQMEHDQILFGKILFTRMAFCAHDSCEGPPGNISPGLIWWGFAPLSCGTQLKTDNE